MHQQNHAGCRVQVWKFKALWLPPAGGEALACTDFPGAAGTTIHGCCGPVGGRNVRLKKREKHTSLALWGRNRGVLVLLLVRWERLHGAMLCFPSMPVWWGSLLWGALALGLTEQAHTACSSPCRAGVCSFFFTTLSLFTCQIQSVCVAEFILNELNITKFIYFKMSKFSQSRFYWHSSQRLVFFSVFNSMSVFITNWICHKLHGLILILKLFLGSDNC